MKKHFLTAVLALGSATVSEADISLNFSENTANQAFAGGQNIGPFATNSSFWNTTNGQANLATGSMSNLINNLGIATGAGVTWTSSNVWYNADGTGSDEARLAVGYLDDGPTSGGFGLQISLTNIPYSQYVVLGLLASDQGATYTTLDFTVNGSLVLGGTATAYGTNAQSITAEGAPWTVLTASNVGNYWASSIQTASTLTITAPPRNGTQRGSLSGLIVQQVPEPATGLLLGIVGAALGLRRRRAK